MSPCCGGSFHRRMASPTMIAASSMCDGCEPICEPSLRVIRMVPSCIQSGPVGTMAMPADPWRLMESRCSWKAVLKSALVVSQPPSTKMV